MSKSVNRRSLLRASASGLALSIVGGDRLDARERNARSPKSKKSGRVESLGNYVPVTIAVPDSVASGDEMCLTMTFDDPSLPNATPVHLFVKAFVGTTSTPAILGITPPATQTPGWDALTLTYFGPQSDSATFMFQVFAPAGQETLFVLEVTDTIDFTTDTPEQSAEIDVY